MCFDIGFVWLKLVKNDSYSRLNESRVFINQLKISCFMDAIAQVSSFRAIVRGSFNFIDRVDGPNCHSIRIFFFIKKKSKVCESINVGLVNVGPFYFGPLANDVVFFS